MSWLSFDLRNYEKALFYMDAGIAEDVRNNPSWVYCPGPRFLLFSLPPKHLWFGRTIGPMRALVERELNRFNGLSGLPALDIDSCWRPFVRRLLTDTATPTPRPIVSALYVFLLESEDLRNELSLREGATSGSNQPFTLHLFTGGLLFESLLKRRYPGNTLEKLLKAPTLWTDFGLKHAPDSTEYSSLANILKSISTAAMPAERAFSTAAKLRNTTGHNLVWDDVFATPSNYVDLFEQVVNAILFVVSRG